eukprot:13792531-Alexandrium_andersonii.AAC.1
MSASLVGSEMCIRDSQWKEPGKTAGGKATRVPAAVANLGAIRCRAMAVSYTHLTLPTICSV